MAVGKFGTKLVSFVARNSMANMFIVKRMPRTGPEICKSLPKVSAQKQQAEATIE